MENVTPQRSQQGIFVTLVILKKSRRQWQRVRIVPDYQPQCQRGAKFTAGLPTPPDQTRHLYVVEMGPRNEKLDSRMAPKGRAARRNTRDKGKGMAKGRSIAERAWPRGRVSNSNDGKANALIGRLIEQHPLGGERLGVLVSCSCRKGFSRK